MITDNLAAYWKLGETSGTRVDLVAGYDLVEVGSVQAGLGKVGSAARFDHHPHNGVLSHVDAPGLRFPNPTAPYAPEWTLAFWFARLTDDSAQVLVKDGLWITIDGARERTIVHYNGVWLINRSTPDDFDYHLYVVRSDGATLGLAIDAGAASTVPASGAPWTPGPFQVNPTGQARGFVDELAKWDRLLSDTEVSDIYNGGAGIDLATYL